MQTWSSLSSRFHSMLFTRTSDMWPFFTYLFMTSRPIFKGHWMAFCVVLFSPCSTQLTLWNRQECFVTMTHCTQSLITVLCQHCCLPGLLPRTTADIRFKEGTRGAARQHRECPYAGCFSFGCNMASRLLPESISQPCRQSAFFGGPVNERLFCVTRLKKFN